MCCSGFLKLMMFIFNGSIFVVGAAILGIGIWVKVDSSSLFGLLENIEELPPEVGLLSNVSYLLIGVGVVLLVIGFLGCCGAVKESKCMLLTFFIIVLIILIIQVAAAVLVLVFQSVAETVFDEVGEKVTADIKNQYGTSNSSSLTSLLNTAMEQFKCCGYRNYTDFEGSPFNSNGLFPKICCDPTVPADECNSSKVQSADIVGCFDKVVQLIKDNGLIIGAVVLAIVAIEIAAMVTSMTIYNRIGNK